MISFGIRQADFAYAFSRLFPLLRSVVNRLARSVLFTARFAPPVFFFNRNFSTTTTRHCRFSAG
jgi:hypothetical protein